VDKDPDSWLNFDPMPDEPFQIGTTPYNGSNDNSGNPVELYYPE
jgi:hypothetical protein